MKRICLWGLSILCVALHGRAASPSLKFSGSTNTGLSAAVANTLSFDTQGTERMNITTTVNTVSPFLLGNIHCDQAIQTASPATGATVTAASTTSILLLTPAGNVTITVVFPSSPTNGQLFSIVSGTGSTINITSSAPGTTIVNAITSLNDNAWAATSGGTMVTYLYLAATTSWYRFARG